jgi:predicted SPOUT superfamily RNA methylase MTH1
MLLPPYLRVRVWRLDPELRYAGLLPPLNIYPHNPEGRAPEVGDIRYGLVLNEHGAVEMGWVKPCRLVEPLTTKVGSVDLFEVVSLEPFLCRRVSRASIYVGYEVVELGSTRDLVNYLGEFQLVINTSKRGVALASVLSDPNSSRKLTTAESICLLFGNPKKDLDEIVERELRVDLTVNFIPYQGVLSIRTLEAVTASLAVLNLLLAN